MEATVVWMSKLNVSNVVNILEKGKSRLYVFEPEKY
jgi:hypothetical protein